MTLLEAAQIYTDLVLVDQWIPETEAVAKEEVGALRSKYHEILMEKLREAGVPFADRFEAMRMAFALLKQPETVPAQGAVVGEGECEYRTP